jgi:hypothetical protein
MLMKVEVDTKIVGEWISVTWDQNGRAMKANLHAVENGTTEKDGDGRSLIMYQELSFSFVLSQSLRALLFCMGTYNVPFSYPLYSVCHCASMG